MDKQHAKPFALIVTLLVVVAGCSFPRVTVRTPDVPVSLRIAVLDFYNEASPTRQDVGRIASERVNDEIFHQSGGEFEVLNRGDITTAMEEANFASPRKMTAQEFMLLGSRLRADIFIVGKVTEYHEGHTRDDRTRAALEVRLISAKDGSIVGVGNYRKEGKEGTSVKHILDRTAQRLALALVPRLTRLAEEAEEAEALSARTAPDSTTPSPSPGQLPPYERPPQRTTPPTRTRPEGS
jgi:curli biogenesis system outer membrane secretion channel CsgG